MKKSLLFAIGFATATAAMLLTACGGQEPTPPTQTKVEKVEIPGTLTLTVGDTHTLEIEFTPSNADNKTVSWSSDNAAAATVDPNTGLVTAIAQGEATITVTTEEGGHKASCTVTVEPVEPEPVDDILPLITDAAFRARCDHMMGLWDLDGDEKLSPAEAAQVTEIIMIEEGIVSLAGFEYFTGLTKVNFNWNSLTELDVTHCADLVELSCYSNRISSLKVAGCAALADLRCNINSIATLDLTGCVSLGLLDCKTNKLTTLDVSPCTSLATLVCEENKIDALDMSANASLMILRADINGMSSLTLPAAGSKLLQLYCAENDLTALDVSGCPDLNYLYCKTNRIAALDVSANAALVNLFADGNSLASLDVSDNPALVNMSCYGNPGDGVSKFPISYKGTKPALSGANWWEYDGIRIDAEFIEVV
ncbi:MAG: Ig-like domain-containing protein [Alistipes sp.]|jgi:hypothetical protein|nr:Ig-like domain-containing protein [Alistipes sp.]